MNKIPSSIQGQQRVIIEHLTPQLEGGRFAIKAFVGDLIKVEADIFLDGHDLLSANLIYKSSKDKNWNTVPMNFVGNDHYQADFSVYENGFYTYTIEAWVNHSARWEHEMVMKIMDGQHVNVELLVGANLLETMAKNGTPSRAEVSDAVMSGRAECVMLNKGPYIVQTVSFLDGLLERMAAHQTKKRSLLRRLSVSQLD